MIDIFARARATTRWTVMLALCVASPIGCASSSTEHSVTDVAAPASGVGFVGFSVFDGGIELAFQGGSVGGTWQVTRGTTTATVVLSSDHVRMPGDLNPVVFAGLTDGDATWTLTGVDGTTASGSFRVGQRFTTFFDATRAVGLTVEGAPAHVTVGATVHVSGSTGSVGLVGKAYVGLPSGAVETVLIGDGAQLAANSPFSFDVSATEDGLVVVELTQTNGLPAAVLPVYVGDAVPLTVTALDAGFTASKTIDGAVFAAEVLAEVNTLRSGLGVASLASHPLLGQTAAGKAEDMAKNHYFAHKSPITGDGVADLAKAVGLTGSVAENLAVEYTPKRAFLGWYWSPVHRAALIDPNWRSHGLGAAVFDGATGQVVFVQHLGTEPAP